MRATGPVTAFAPGGVGNVGPGLDILGLTVAGAGDTVSAEWTDQPGVHVLEPGHPSLPTDPNSHPGAPPRVRLPLLVQPVGPAQNVLTTFMGDFAYGAPRVSIKRGTTFSWSCGRWNCNWAQRPMMS